MRKADNLPPYCAVVMKPGSLNFLEPSGPAQGLLWENVFVINYQDQDVDGMIILRLIFRKWEGVVGTGWSWLRIGTGGGRL